MSYLLEETEKITNIIKKSLPAEEWETKIEAYRILSPSSCFSVVESASGTVGGSTWVNIKGQTPIDITKKKTFIGTLDTTPLHQNFHRKSTKARKQSSKKIQSNQSK